MVFAGKLFASCALAVQYHITCPRTESVKRPRKNTKYEVEKEGRESATNPNQSEAQEGTGLSLGQTKKEDAVECGRRGGGENSRRRDHGKVHACVEEGSALLLPSSTEKK